MSVFVFAIVGVESFTRANEEHIIRLFRRLDSMDSDLRVANVTF